MPHCAASSRPAGRLGVERVALEVEEQVAVIGARQRAERLRRDHLVRRDGGAAGASGGSTTRRGGWSAGRARRALELQPGLRPQHRERVGVHARRRRRGASASSSIVTIPAARSRSRCTGRMPATSSRSREATTSASQVAQRPQATTPSSPRGSPQAIAAPSSAEVEPAIGDERGEPLAAEREDREQIVDRVRADGAVAEQQLDAVGARRRRAGRAGRRMPRAA